MLGSKQKLAVFLSKLKVFEVPVLSLEQYPTDGEIAATILWDAHMQGEIADKTVADFGCGTGILGIGALALGAKHVTFIEMDPTIFPILMENLHFLEQELGEEYANYEIIHGRVENYGVPVDLVLQNPPFGTQEKHADMIFVKQAISLAPVVYSLHKTSTEEYLKSWVQQNNVRIGSIARFEFPLKKSMPQHGKRVQHIEVSCFKFLT